MSKIKTLEYTVFETGKKYRVRPVVMTYQDNGTLFVGLDCKRLGYYFGVTVNLDGSENLEPYCAAVRCCGIDESGVIPFLLENDLAEPIPKFIQSGFNTYPVFKFNREVLSRYNPEGVAKYEAELMKKNGGSNE